MPDQAARIREFLDKQDCTELVYKFARGIDRMDAELVRSVFHPDGTDDHGIFQGSVADYVPWLMDIMGTMKLSQHAICNVLIEIDGDVAHGESYFIAHHELVRDGQDQYYHAAGRYLDRFERRDGVWKIAHRLAAYDWSERGPSSDFFDRLATGKGARTFGQRGRQDASYKR
jgi:hypothetical protein